MGSCKSPTIESNYASFCFSTDLNIFLLRSFTFQLQEIQPPFVIVSKQQFIKAAFLKIEVAFFKSWTSK